MSLLISKERFRAIDLLRGFFIVTIICDHLSRWPSLFEVLSGQALLWVTAAEGFVIISGLLVGYVRGYKSKKHALKEITFKLWRRAFILYLWVVIGSIVYTIIMWHVTLIGGGPIMPIAKGDWAKLLTESILLNYTFLWVYFLKLYAVFLAVAPIAIWLLRKSRAGIAILLSFAVLALGWVTKSEVLQWQFIFFIPVIAGYYMTNIQDWWQKQTKNTRLVLSTIIVVMSVIIIVLSMIGTYTPLTSPVLDMTTVNLFAKDSISLARAGVAFLLFTGYLLVFIYLEKYINKWFGWLLMPIGTHSLTAYILHGFAIILISFFFVSSTNFITNTLLGILAVLLVWFLIRIPGINKIIPR